MRRYQRREEEEKGWSGNAKDEHENTLFYWKKNPDVSWLDLVSLPRERSRVKTLCERRSPQELKETQEESRNRMAFIPCHLLLEALLSSLPLCLIPFSPFAFPFSFSLSLGEQVVKRFPIKRPSCCRWHVAGNRYKGYNMGKEVKWVTKNRGPFICISTIISIDNWGSHAASAEICHRLFPPPWQKFPEIVRASFFIYLHINEFVPSRPMKRETRSCI